MCLVSLAAHRRCPAQQWVSPATLTSGPWCARTGCRCEAGSGAASRGAHHADEACDQALPPCCSSCALSAIERTVRALAKGSAGVAVAPVYALLCMMVHAE